MVKIHNLIEGLSKAQIRMLGIVANIEWCRAIDKGHKVYADELRNNGIEFVDLVDFMEVKHRMLIFGTDDYFEITGELDPYKSYEEKIVC